MKRMMVKSWLIALLIGFFTVGISQAITINSVTPNPAGAGVPVSISLSAGGFLAVPPAVCGAIGITFGDGQSTAFNVPGTPVGAGLLCSGFTTVTHSYATAGTYLISASNANYPPSPATASVTVSGPPPPPTVSGLTVSPSPVRMNETVTARFSPGSAGSFCGYEINFGDGSGFQNLGGCTPNDLSPPCQLTKGHIYTQPGTYTVSVRGSGLRCAPPLSTQVIVSNLGEITLPPGTVTIPYSYEFPIPPKAQNLPYFYTLFLGPLPPGLILSPSGQTAKLSGTPTKSGRYTFTLTIRDVTGNFYQQKYLLLVGVPPVNIQATPESFNIPRTFSSTNNVVYKFSSPSPLNLSLTSNSGVFLAGGEVVGTVNQPIIVNLLNGKAEARETITVAPGVIEKATGEAKTLAQAKMRAMAKGSNVLIYQRTFANGEIGGESRVIYNLTTAAGAGFAIKYMNLYFDNRRAEITIDRSFPLLKAYVDIGYVGTGLLQGFWEVDGRIMGFVNQHLASGEYVTFEAPNVPPLPTYDTGSHLIRFVITNPVIALPQPTAVYFVTAEDYLVSTKIGLLKPGKNSENEYRPVKFQWEPLGRSSLYLVEFFGRKGGKPIFSALIKKPEYILPDFSLSSIFEKGTGYSWRVKGFDQKNRVIGESDLWYFDFNKP